MVINIFFSFTLPKQVQQGLRDQFAKSTDSSLEPADTQQATKIKMKVWHLCLFWISLLWDLKLWVRFLLNSAHKYVNCVYLEEVISPTSQLKAPR
jgi:hypothetical protein